MYGPKGIAHSVDTAQVILNDYKGNIEILELPQQLTDRNEIIEEGEEYENRRGMGL